MKYIFIVTAILSVLLVFPFYETILGILSVLVLLGLNKFYQREVLKNIVIRRFIENNKIFNGDSTRAGVWIENKGYVPIIGFIYDYTSMELSYKQKEVFFMFLPPKSKKLFSYRVFGTKRGDHHLGSTMIEFKDMFMNTFLTKEYDTVDFITVFPMILPHGELDKSILQPYGEIKNKLPIFEDLTKIQGVREYQYGDEIRKINWKISARYDKLYVNYYSPSVSSGSIVFLNLYHHDYEMRYPDFYEEFAIELATTIIFDLYNYHQEIGLITNGEIRRRVSIKGNFIIQNPLGFFEVPISSGDTFISNMFELLARVYPQNKITFLDMIKNISSQIPWGTAIIVITPKLDDEIALMLYDISSKGHEVFIYNVHPNRSIEPLGSRNIKSYNVLKVESTVRVERVV